MNATRWVIPVLVALTMIFGDCAEIQARGRLFGRRHARQCCRSQCPPACSPPCGPCAPTYGTSYICPMYRMGQVSNGVWMYYMATRNEDGVCGSNPFADYYGNIVTGCHATNTYCYPVVNPLTTSLKEEDGRLHPAAHGNPQGTACQTGYSGPIPRFVIDNQIDYFEGYYGPEAARVHVKCYTIEMDHATGRKLRLNVGFQVADALAAAGPGTYHRMGRKCGVVDRDGDPVTKDDQHQIILLAD